LPLGPVKRATDIWLGTTQVTVPEPTQIEFFTSSTGLETIWLNDKVVFRREKPGGTSYSDRFEARLAKGPNRILLRLAETRETAEFQLRFRRKSAAPQQERFAAAALSRAGNPALGKQIFLN